MDLDAVIDAAAKAGTMIEINANPHRLDLDAVHCRRAAEKGVAIVINPDAHSVGGLDDLDYGISVARRGWLEKADVWNTAPLKTMVQRIRQRAGTAVTDPALGRLRRLAAGPCGGGGVAYNVNKSGIGMGAWIALIKSTRDVDPPPPGGPMIMEGDVGCRRRSLRGARPIFLGPGPGTAWML